MTIIAWDGKHLVCDSQSTRRLHGAPIKDMNKLKLILLNTPWIVGKTQEGHPRYLTAIAGTGLSHQIRMVTEVINVFSDNAVPFEEFKTKLSYMFNECKVNCRIVGCGYVDGPTGRKPFGMMVYGDSAGQIAWGSNPIVISHVGSSDMAHVSPKIGSPFRSAVEYASYHCFIKDCCGGRLMSYNPVTDKLDSPNHISPARIKAIAKKLREVEINKVNAKYDTIMNPTTV